MVHCIHMQRLCCSIWDASQVVSVLHKILMPADFLHFAVSVTGSKTPYCNKIAKTINDSSASWTSYAPKAWLR